MRIHDTPVDLDDVEKLHAAVQDFVQELIDQRAEQQERADGLQTELEEAQERIKELELENEKLQTRVDELEEQAA